MSHPHLIVITVAVLKHMIDVDGIGKKNQVCHHVDNQDCALLFSLFLP